MTTLNETGRKRVIEMASAEIKVLLKTASLMIEKYRKEAEDELRTEHGMEDDILKMRALRDQIEAAQRELAEIETRHNWRKEIPLVYDYRAAGFELQGQEDGKVQQYQTPTIFGWNINSKWDLELYKKIDARLQLRRVALLLNQVEHAVVREIALAGTYEKARESYGKLYQLLKAACGDAMPPLLAEIVEIPVLLPSPEKQDRIDGETA